MSALRKIKPLRSEIIYGPVKSRRFGMSLGINISGNGKFCSFNCPYCFRGKNHGRPDHPDFAKGIPDVKTVVSELKEFLKRYSGDNIDDWSIAGNAEPTDHPQFPAIVEKLITLKKESYPGVKLSVLTNGMGLVPRLNDQYRLFVDALNELDRACLKLDGGTRNTWIKLARPYSKVAFYEWLEAVAKITNPVIQTMLVQGRIDNTTNEEIAAFKAIHERLKPSKVHLLTINKQPLDSALIPVSDYVLKNIQTEFEKNRHRYSLNASAM